MKPTQEQDAQLARELVPNGIIIREPWVPRQPLATTLEQLKLRQRIARERVRSVKEERARGPKRCALCGHPWHLNRCALCRCPR